MQIIASFDDGAKDDMIVATLMKKYKIPTILYIPYEFRAYNQAHNRDGLSWHEVRALAEDFEIGSHSVTHRLLTRIEASEAEWEITESKRMWEQALKRPIKSFCYPRGYATDNIRQMVRGAGYTRARNTLVGNIKQPEDMIWETGTVHVGCNTRKELEGKSWQTKARRLFYEAKENDGYYHIWGHSWEITKNKAWDDLEALLAEITA